MLGRTNRLVLCVMALALSVLLAGGCASQGQPSSASSSSENKVTAETSSSSAQAQANPAPSTTSPSGSSVSTDSDSPSAATQKESASRAETDVANLRLAINGNPVEVAWENNESVATLAQRAAERPIEVQMSPHGGFEQFGPFGFSLPSNDAQTTAEPGDVMLYTGNQIVVFYGSNSWAYTRLGKITDKTAGELADMLGGNAVTLTIEEAR